MEFPCNLNTVENVVNQDEDYNVLENNRHIENIELEFCDIYQEAIRTLFDVEDGNNILYLRRYFRIFLPLVNTWCAFSKSVILDKNSRRLLTSSLYYRLTYIYRSCVVLSSAVASHFQNVLMENPVFCKELQQKKSVKICSLGSGPASDVVGIVKVLETVAEIMKIEMEVFVTIIDSDLGWKNAAMVVLSGLKQFHGSVWKITFIQTDLSSEFSPSTLKAIQDADILSMVHLVSEFTSTNVSVKKTSMLQKTFKNITDVILPGSMLFVLDFSRQDIIRTCGGNTGRVPNFQIVYEELCDFYTLQATAIQKLLVLYLKSFPTLGCNRTMKAFVRVWIRTIPNEGRRTTLDRLSQKNRFLTTKKNQNSLNTSNYFQNWEQRFRKEMAKLGWSRRSINKVISGHHENRSRLLKQHTEKKKLVKGAREKLIEKGVEENTRYIEENAWEEYFKARTDLSYVDNQIYSVSIFNFKCNQKRKVLGYNKKH